MSNENFQNTTEIKAQNTAEIRLQSTRDLKNPDGFDFFSEQVTKKEKVVSIIVCVVIAFIIWLIISNINLKASTPVTLPLSNTDTQKLIELPLQIWKR